MIIDQVKEAIKLAGESPNIPDRSELCQNGQSFTPFLYRFIILTDPKTVLEWGPGNSTHLFLNTSKDVKVFSYEHAEEWYTHWTNELMKEFGDRCNITLATDEKEYVSPDFPEETFDIIFVDGIWRDQCIKNNIKLLKKETGTLMMHDSHRDYIEMDVKGLEYISTYVDKIQPIEHVAIWRRK